MSKAPNLHSSLGAASQEKDGLNAEVQFTPNSFFSNVTFQTKLKCKNKHYLLGSTGGAFKSSLLSLVFMADVTNAPRDKQVWQVRHPGSGFIK